MPLLINPHFRASTDLEPRLTRDAGAAVAEALDAIFDHARTPLVSLGGLARHSGLASIHVKDEGRRLGLKSFKALGGAYAVFQLIRAAATAQLGREVEWGDLPRPASGSLAPTASAEHDRVSSPEIAKLAAGMTFACATDGNHGQSVAAGARLVGARAVIFVHQGVSAERRAAIARFGARIEIVAGNYDDAVAEATQSCEANDWVLLSDTSWPGYEDVPLRVMQGYTLIAHEAASQLDEPPTHVFLQAGVGGFAAALAVAFTSAYPESPPSLIVVEPARAACLMASAQAGRPTRIVAGAPTVMSMLECYEPSLVAWNILQQLATGFMTVDEDAAVSAVKTLAWPTRPDPAIVAGESGAAGLAGLLVACNDEDMKAALTLSASSRVLLVNTESATDVASYLTIVGATPDQISLIGAIDSSRAPTPFN